jgi:phosphatidylglycerophosphate synthase
MDTLKDLKRNTPNFLSFFRIIIFPVLLLLISHSEKNIFKWLLALCFFSDLIDGYIARKLKIKSKLGSKMDSIGDMLTLFACLAGLLAFETEFLLAHLLIISWTFGLYVLQLIICLIKYKQPSNFHTYSAKAAFLLTGPFFIYTFFFGVELRLFWLVIFFGNLECIEEICIAFLLPKPKQNVKSIFHVLRERRRAIN